MPASGTTTVNFGAFPGSAEAEVDVSGQSGFVASSEVEAWVQPIATADHSADEHKIENIRVLATYKVDGTFTINGYVVPFPQTRVINYSRGRAPGGGVEGLSQSHRLYGQFTVAWAWN